MIASLAISLFEIRLGACKKSAQVSQTVGKTQHWRALLAQPMLCSLTVCNRSLVD